MMLVVRGLIQHHHRVAAEPAPIRGEIGDDVVKEPVGEAGQTVVGAGEARAGRGVVERIKLQAGHLVRRGGRAEDRGAEAALHTGERKAAINGVVLG